MIMPSTRQFAFAVAAVATILPAAVTFADEAKPGSMVCLDAREITSTKILNDHQILFYLPGHKVWINDLPNRCYGLRDNEGFSRVSSNPEYCDNLETIRVRPTGETCLLGKFSPYDQTASVR